MTDVKEINDLANKLQTEAAKLNKNAPTVNELLTIADEKLAAANPGMEVWLSTYLDKTPESEWWEDRRGDSRRMGIEFFAYQIGYARVSDGWGLASRVVKVSRSDDYPDTKDRVIVEVWRRLPDDARAIVNSVGPKVMPLRNAPLNVRIGALAHLPEVFENLTALVIKRNVTIAEATKQLKK